MTARTEDREVLDDGFTLIELVIYCGLLAMVLGIVGSLIISGVTNQRRVSETASATSSAQLVTSSMGPGIRNAKAINSPTASSPLLVVESVDRTTAGAPICQAWYYDATEKTIRTTTLTTLAKISIPTAAQAKTWTLLASNVAPMTSGAAVFQTSSATVTAAFRIAPTGGIDQITNTTFTSRQQSVGGTSTCFA